MKAFLGFTSLLIILPLYATKQKLSRIINDTGQEYIVQLKRSSKNNSPEYLCRSIHGFCLVDFSYEVYKNKIETDWYEHVTQLENNIAYQFVMRPRDSLSILIFAKANKLAEASFSFESLPHSISLAGLLGKEGDAKHESKKGAKIKLLHIVKNYQYSARVDQKKLHKANL